MIRNVMNREMKWRLDIYENAQEILVRYVMEGKKCSLQDLYGKDEDLDFLPELKDEIDRQWSLKEVDLAERVGIEQQEIFQNIIENSIDELVHNELLYEEHYYHLEDMKYNGGAEKYIDN